MKKFLCVVLAITCVLSLVACGNNSTANKTADKAFASVVEKAPNKTDGVAKVEKPEETQPTTDSEVDLETEETLPSKSDKEIDKDVEADKKHKNEKENKGEKDPDTTKPTNETIKQFNAKVLEILEASILVEPVFGSTELNSANKIYVDTTELKLPKNLQINDYVRITYNGVILESYPAQINSAFELVKHGSSFIAPTNPEILKPVVTFENHVVYANWTDNHLIQSGSISPDSMYPVYKLETEQDVNDFRAKFESLLSFNAFDEVVAAYDDAFFEENTIVLAYVTANSGSVRYSVFDVEFFETGVNIKLAIDAPEYGTCDMAGWFVMVVLPKATLENCTEYNVYTESLFKGISEVISKKATF